MTVELSRIVLDPHVLDREPVIRGTRLSVEFILGLMPDGWNEGDAQARYPCIERGDVLACLAYAREILSSERIFPAAA